MNALRTDTLALDLPPESPVPRRRQVAGMALDDKQVARFNEVLAHLDPNAPRISADQVVTLARWLQDLPRERAVAILSERLARVEQLRRMLNDADWHVDSELRERSRVLISYLQQVDDLIPDDQPLVGHLDDALLVELAWPAFRDQTLDYGDYCRFLSEQRPRGSAHERRLAWENACLAEAALLQQRRDVRARSYAAPAPLPLHFRVS